MNIEQLEIPLQNLLFRAKVNTAPLLVIMHGLGDNMYSYQDFHQMLFPEKMHTLLLNAPFPYFMGWKWYDLDGEQEAGLTQSRKLIEESIEILQKRLYIQKHQIFLSGFSQGGVVSLYTGLRSHTPFGGIISLSGYLVGEKENFTIESLQTPIYMAHGIFDDLIPINLGKSHANYLKKLGYDVFWKEFRIAHSINYEEVESLKEWLNDKII